MAKVGLHLILVFLLLTCFNCEDAMTLQSLLGGSFQISTNNAQTKADQSSCSACNNKPVNNLSPQNCNEANHAYWSGTQCNCHVGYEWKQNACVQIGSDVTNVAKPIDEKSIFLASSVANPSSKDNSLQISDLKTQEKTNTQESKTENQKIIPKIQQVSPSSTPICKQNQFLENGICTPCPKTMIYNLNSKKCVCPESQSLNTLGICQTMSKISNAQATQKNETLLTGTELQLQGQIKANSNNIMVSLKTSPTFTFKDQNEMQSFLTLTFSNSIKPTVYSNQRKEELSIFDVLLIYPSGIPNSKFIVNFKFDFKGKRGSLDVVIDPILASKANSRRQRIE